MNSELRHDPIVKAWINTYQTNNVWKKQYTDCKYCGWPHSGMCGSVFGVMKLCGDNYWIDQSNVEYMLDFVQNLGSGFHWKNEIFFDVIDEKITIQFFEKYNNTPQKKSWIVPINEWKSIVKFIEDKGDL
jgi:hypothetical protein